MGNQVYPSAVRGLGYTVIKAPEDSVLVQQAPSYAQTRIIQSQNPIWTWTLIYDFIADNPINAMCGVITPTNRIWRPNPVYPYPDLQELLGFVTSRRNSYDDFLFLDPDDNFVGPGIITQGWLPAYMFAFGDIIVVSGNAWQVSSAPAGAVTGYQQPAFSSSPQIDGGITWTQLGTVAGAGWPNPKAQLQLVTDGTNWYSPIQLYRGGQFYEDITDFASSLQVYANGALTAAYTLSAGPLSFSGFSSAGLYLNWGTTQPSAPITATFNYYFRVHFADNTQDFEKWANGWWTMGGSEGIKGKGELKLTTSRIAYNSASGSFGTPAPPICNPGTQVAVLYPTTIQLTQGTGSAVGQAGLNAYARLTMPFVSIFAVSPQAVFSGFSLPPNVPPTAVKAIYAYTTNVPVFPQSPNVLVNGQVTWTGNVQLFPFHGTPIEFGASASGVGAVNFPFTSLQFTMNLAGSVPAHYSPPTGWVYTPRVYVYY